MGLKHVMICEPLELEYVAAGIPAEHEVQIFDGIVEKGLERRLRSFQPDVIGTSCYITGVNEVKKLCRTAKRLLPAVRTIVGGVHASQCPEDFDDASVDVIVLGDGTSLIAEILQAFETGAPLDELPGLAFPTGTGDVRRTEKKAYMPKADTLPFPRRDLVKHLMHRYFYLTHQPVATMKTTWGCWYKCNFCFTWRITEGHPYSRSPESIADELEQIECEDVYIVDDIFLINRSRLTKLAEILRERNIRKKYLVYGRADFIAENEDMIAEWAALGLSAVLIGLEAATDPELDSMNKECTADYNRQAIEVLRRHGVDTYGSLIPQPDYTEAEWDRLFRFIDETGLYYLNISPLTPLPGTVIWHLYKDQITVPRSAHGLWDLSHVVLPTKMPLKKYYRALWKVYAKSVLDFRRAEKVTLRTRPPLWHWRYLRLLFGAAKMSVQLWFAHRHHHPSAIKKAMEA